MIPPYHPLPHQIHRLHLRKKAISWKHAFSWSPSRVASPIFIVKLKVSRNYSPRSILSHKNKKRITFCPNHEHSLPLRIFTTAFCDRHVAHSFVIWELYYTQPPIDCCIKQYEIHKINIYFKFSHYHCLHVVFINLFSISEFGQHLPAIMGGGVSASRQKLSKIIRFHKG